MKLVLYSGGIVGESETLDLELISLINHYDPIFTLIPASSEDSDIHYEEFVQHFSPYGVRKFHLLCVDQPLDFHEIKAALRSDMIFLSGGNTFYFAKHLRKSGLFKLLPQYVKHGGVLAGESAGAIILTPNINTASFPKFDRDDNDVDLYNWKGMNLVPFEFFPHYVNTKRYIHELNVESKNLLHPIFATSDGAGVVIHDERTSFIGPTWGFFRGKKFRL